MTVVGTVADFPEGTHRIVSVEGRQAAWIRRIVYGPTYSSPRQYPAPSAYDLPLTAAQVKAKLAATGFIKGPF